MEATQVRKQLHDYIDNSNDNVVEALLSFLKANNNDIVKDELIDLDEYNDDIDAAMTEFKKGNFTSHEDVKKELQLL
jgi:guanylate kinase